MVEVVGATETEPGVEPPVVKVELVQEVALVESQVSVEGEPCVTVSGESEMEQEGPTAQLAYAYEPESVPLLQARDWEVQVEPYGTVDAWYAVIEEP